MADLLIVKNISREGPGLLAGVLKKHGVSYDVVDLDEGASFPSPLGYKALVVLGGPDSANDTTEKMQQELVQVRLAFANDIPYLGICLGLQVAVKAAGGRVLLGAQKEIGFIDPAGQPYTVSLSDAGTQDPLLTGLSSPLAVLQLHGEVVELTPAMALLASSPICPQIVKVADKAYGIQSHFELTEEMLALWAEQDPDLQPLGYEKLSAEFAAIRQQYTGIGERLLTNFLQIAGLVS